MKLLFESSGTTQSAKSKHYVKHLNVYIESFTKCFELFYGDIKDWCIIGLLAILPGAKKFFVSKNG